MRKPKIYEMRQEGWETKWDLYVFKTVKDMQHYLRANIKGDFDGVLGLVEPLALNNGTFAACYLNEENMGSGLIAHEMLHVAMARERYIGFKCDYGDTVGQNEERLAYFLTDCMIGCVNTLRDNGHIKKEKY